MVVSDVNFRLIERSCLIQNGPKEAATYETSDVISKRKTPGRY